MTLHVVTVEGEKGEFPEPDGDIVEVLDYNARRHKLRLLVRRDEAESSREDAAETVHTADGESFEVEKLTCAGKDGECSREVDSAGAYCWQHSE